MEKNYKALDIMKFICAILVIVIHTNPFVNYEVFFIINNNIARIAVPLFFIASGYLIYGKYKIDKRYILKYLKSLIKLIVIWAMIYLPYNIYTYGISEESVLKNIFSYIRNFLFNGTYRQLWYLNSLLISIIFIVFLHKYLSLKYLGIIGLLLYLVGISGDSYYGFFSNKIINNIVDFYSIIFINTRNGILFGVIFILIGMVIHEYNLNLKLKKKKNIYYILGISVIFVSETFLLRKLEIAKDYNMMISLLFIAPLIFILVLNSTKFEYVENTRIFRELSLWIYCIHGIFLIINDELLKFTGGECFFFVLSFSILSYFIFEKIK